MARFCEFVDQGSNQIVFVNPDTVRTIGATANNDGTIIQFDDAHSITVPQPVETVAKKMKDA